VILFHYYINITLNRPDWSLVTFWSIVSNDGPVSILFDSALSAEIERYKLEAQVSLYRSPDKNKSS
jgi:hypothetical protein